MTAEVEKFISPGETDLNFCNYFAVPKIILLICFLKIKARALIAVSLVKFFSKNLK